MSGVCETTQPWAAAYLHFWSLLCFGDVVVDVHIVAQLDANLDDIQTHLDDMLAGGAIVSGPHIAFECILQAWQAFERISQKIL